MQFFKIFLITCLIFNANHILAQENIFDLDDSYMLKANKELINLDKIGITAVNNQFYCYLGLGTDLAVKNYDIRQQALSEAGCKKDKLGFKMSIFQGWSRPDDVYIDTILIDQIYLKATAGGLEYIFWQLYNRAFVQLNILKYDLVEEFYQRSDVDQKLIKTQVARSYALGAGLNYLLNPDFYVAVNYNRILSDSAFTKYALTVSIGIYSNYPYLNRYF